MPRRGLLFLAVPDGAVSEMATRIARMKPPAELGIVHLSGALGLDALSALEGNPRGSFHPLQSFPMPRDPAAFRGITVAIDATTPTLMRQLRALARAIGAKAKHVGDEQRVLYHAAAVYASNFVDVVVEEAIRLLEQIGWTAAEGRDALLPLVQGAVANIRARGPVEALTGPIRRGDAETVSRHLDALRSLFRTNGARGPERAAGPADRQGRRDRNGHRPTPPLRGAAERHARPTVLKQVQNAKCKAFGNRH